MKRIVFLVLWMIPFLEFQARADVEIYADGHKYASFQAYVASKKPVVVKTAAPTPATLNSQQEDYIRQEAKELGINVDLSKVKTFQVNSKGASDPTLHKLYVLSVEKGMVGALQGFDQSWGQPDPLTPQRISSEQLQAAIQRAVVSSNAPKLLISEPGKVRILALTADNSKK